MKKRFLLLAGIFVASIIGATFNFNNHTAYATVPGTNTLVSAKTSGGSAASASAKSYISDNGKFVLFSSSSYQVVSSDTNNKSDVFVRNLASNTSTRVSLTDTGGQINSDTSGSAISETGRYIIFRSNASNLISGVTVPTTYYQLYLRDTVANTTTLLSQTSSGTIANAEIFGQDISADGRFVLFTSAATNLGPSITNTGLNVYMLDRSDGSFTVLNYKYDGTLPDTGFSNLATAQMSCDGSLIAFKVSAVLTTTSSSHLDVYFMDRRAGNKLTNLTAWTNGAAGSPNISCNGDYISFASSAYNIDAAFTSNPSSQHRGYVYDRINNTYTLVDKTSAGVPSASPASCNVNADPCVQISDTGIAAFASSSSDLSSFGATYKEIYVRNLETGVTELLSQGSGSAGNLASDYPSISSSGRIVSYGSSATNLVSATDSNNDMDVFTSLTGY